MGFNILHVCETLPGGPASYLDEVLGYQCQSEKYSNVGLMAPLAQFSLLNLPSKVICTKIFFQNRILRTLCIMVLLFRILWKTKDPTIVHLHSTFAGVGGRLIKYFVPRRHKFIYCSHGWVFNRVGVGVISIFAYEIIEKFLSFFSDAVICISGFDYKEGLRIGISEKKMKLVVNGVSDFSDDVDLNKYSEKWIDGKLKVLFVGRLDRQKGFDVLLGAASYLSNVSFLVAGSGVVDSLEYNVNLPNVKMLGWVNRFDVRCLMRTCDILVVPSRWEGFGLVAAEAFSAGKPVVATKVGGLREIVSDGVSGYHVSPGSVEDLINSIQKFDVDILNRMSLAARAEYEKKYTAMRMNDDITNVYFLIANG